MVELGERGDVGDFVERGVEFAEVDERGDAREVLNLGTVAIQSTVSRWKALPKARISGRTLLLRRSCERAGMSRPTPERSSSVVSARISRKVHASRLSVPASAARYSGVKHDAG